MLAMQKSCEVISEQPASLRDLAGQEKSPRALIL